MFSTVMTSRIDFPKDGIMNFEQRFSTVHEIYYNLKISEI